MGSRARRNISRNKGLREEKKRKRVRKSKVRDERSTWGEKKRDAKKTGNRVDRKRTEERTDG